MKTGKTVIIVLGLLVALSYGLCPVSGAPGDVQLTSEIPDMSTNEDTDILSAFNLNDHFSGISPEFYYTSTGGNVQATIHADGTVDIFGPADWYGSEELVFHARSGEETVSDGITVTYLAVNDAPYQIRTMDPISIREGCSHSLDLDQYFRDVDSQMAISAYGLQDNLVVSIESGDLLIRANSGWYGEEDVNIRITDGEFVLFSTLSVAILPVNDAPVAEASEIYYTAQEDDTLDIRLKDHFRDIDSQLDFAIAAGHDRITATITDHDMLVIMPERDWSGVASVEVVASDGEFQVNITFVIEVLSVNDAPHVSAPLTSITFPVNDRVSLDLDSYFYDMDGEDLQFMITGNELIGVELDPETNVLTLNNPKDWVGTESITITAIDTSGESVGQEVEVNVVETSATLGISMILYALAICLGIILIGIRIRSRGGRRSVGSSRPWGSSPSRTGSSRAITSSCTLRRTWSGSAMGRTARKRSPSR